MLSKQSSLLFVFIILIAQSAIAEQILKLDRTVVGFVNQSAPETILLMSQDGQINWISGAKILRSQSLQITDPACMPYSQNTALMGAGHNGMTLAYPFLVGAGQACRIDERTNSVRLVSKFNVPEGAYSVVYAGEDTSASYFLINGRPSKTDGYLKLISIDKRSYKLEVRDFVTDVPGYSGAMLFDQDGLWVTVWPGDIYKIPHQSLTDLIQKGSSVTFAEIAMKQFTGIDGMSLFMIGNSQSLLYFNGEYESYTVKRLNGERAKASLPCPPLAGAGSNWLVLCNGNSIESWTN